MADNNSSNLITYSEAEIGEMIPQLGRDDNKYTRGELTVIGGCAKYPGAAIMASWASQIMGAGYTRVVCAPESVDLVRSARPSLVVLSWDDIARPELCRKATHPQGTLVGSGFDGADPVTNDLAVYVIENMPGPLVVDGGAITALASPEGIAASRARAEKGFPLVVTPHTGEAARLARGAQIDDGPSPELSPKLAQFYHAVIVLKGPDTYISDGERVAAMTSGTPALAKAGTGDALAGMTGALVTLGMEPFEAGVLASTLHAEGGRIASDRLCELSVCPEDVIEALPQAIRLFSQR